MEKSQSSSRYYGVIMAGGVGERFWPMSRRKKPKQFLDILAQDETLIQSTYRRMTMLLDATHIHVVTNANYLGLVQDQLPDLLVANIALEPVARNTAPCIAYSALRIVKEDPEAIIAFLPSDHHIGNVDEFAESMLKAFKFCEENDAIVTLGIKPSSPEIGYGYIQADEDAANGELYEVKSFTEKPTLELAMQFIDSGDFYWNAGMFIAKGRVLLEEFATHTPEIHELLTEVKADMNTPREAKAIQKAYESCPNISMDYGVMEKSKRIFVLPASMTWSDVGTWQALYKHSKKDVNGNVVKGAQVKSLNASNNIVVVSSQKLVALSDVDDLIVIERDGILFIGRKSLEQNVKAVVTDVNIKFGDQFS